MFGWPDSDCFGPDPAVVRQQARDLRRKFSQPAPGDASGGSGTADAEAWLDAGAQALRNNHMSPVARAMAQLSADGVGNVATDEMRKRAEQPAKARVPLLERIAAIKERAAERKELWETGDATDGSQALDLHEIWEDEAVEDDEVDNVLAPDVALSYAAFAQMPEFLAAEARARDKVHSAEDDDDSTLDAGSDDPAVAAEALSAWLGEAPSTADADAACTGATSHDQRSAESSSNLSASSALSAHNESYISDYATGGTVAASQTHSSAAGTSAGVVSFSLLQQQWNVLHPLYASAASWPRVTSTDGKGTQVRSPALRFCCVSDAAIERVRHCCLRA